jgi:hypothetical protein
LDDELRALSLRRLDDVVRDLDVGRVADFTGLR